MESNPSQSAVVEFEGLLQAMQAGRPPGVSGSKIHRITEIAVENVQSESLLIQKIFTHFKRSPGTHKLGVLYAVDSISRAYQDCARKDSETVAASAEGTFAAGVHRLTDILESLMNDIMQNAPDDQKDKIRKLIDIWEKTETFPPDLLKTIVSRHFPNSPATLPSEQGEAGLQQVQGVPAGADTAKADQKAPDTNAILQALASIAKSNTTQKGNAMPNAAFSSTSASNTNANQNSNSQAQSLLASLAQNGSIPQQQPPVQAPGFPQQGGPPDPAQQQQLAFLQMLAQQNPAQFATLLQGVPQVPSANSAMAGAPQGIPLWQQQQMPSQGGMPGSLRSPRGRRSRSPSPRRRRSPGDRRRSPPRNDSSYQPPPMLMTNAAQEQKWIEMDDQLKPDRIRVYSRTLFVGGVSPGMAEADMRERFRAFGEVQTCIMHAEKRHAFVKMFSRRESVAAKDGLEGSGSNLRTRWGVGFGPRDCSDYATGVSVIPLTRLTDADRRWITTAEYGGTGGRPLEAGMCMEEPDIIVGAGMSSKAMSKRMPTNTSRQGPHSTDSMSPGPQPMQGQAQFPFNGQMPANFQFPFGMAGFPNFGNSQPNAGSSSSQQANTSSFPGFPMFFPPQQ